jgi:predicted RNase H-like HicB family nuclease
MTQSRKLRVPLRVVFYREGESWIAHCLEFDLVGDGATKEDALDALSDAIGLQLQASLEHENLANLFAPADGELFRKYAAGIGIAKGDLTVNINRLRQSAPIIEDVEVREYEESQDLVLA